MFSFCKLLYLYMFRCGAREAVRGASCFPTDRADLHRCRSGRANPTDRAQARQMPQMPFGCCLFSHRSRRFAQMPFGVLLVFPQIAQICTDAVRGVSCFPADCADLHRCRSGRANPTDRAQARQMPQMPFGVFLVIPQIAQICTDARSGRFLFSTQIAPLAPRCKRKFCYNVTCYMLQ